MRYYLPFFFLFFFHIAQSQYIDTKFLSADNDLFSNHIHTLHANGETFYIGSRAGLAVKNGNTYPISPQSLQYKFNNIYDIYEDPKGGKWIAGLGQGVLYFHENTTKLFNQKNGLIQDNVRTIFHHNGIMYVGTVNGISTISLNDFSIKNPKFVQNKDFEFTITSFFSIHNKVYATTINDGIFEITPHKVVKVSNIVKPYSSIVYQNKLYIGTETELLFLNPDSFEIEKRFTLGSVWKFKTSHDALYFVASNIFESKGGIYEIKNDEIINLTKKFEIPYTDLISLAYDCTNQYLYVGTFDNGLIQVNLNAPINKFPNYHDITCMNVANNHQYLFHKKGVSLLVNNITIREISLDRLKEFQVKNPSKFRNQAVLQNHFFHLEDQLPAEKIVFYHSVMHQQELWVATNIGIFVLSLNGDLKKYYPIHTFFFTFFQNQLIMPVPYGGVRIFKDLDAFTYRYDHDFNNPSIPESIVSIAQTKEAVYFGSALSGLYEYKNGTYTSMLQNNSFNQAKIKRITTTEKGDLIVVTDFNDVYLLDVSQSKVKIKKHISHEKIKGSTTFFVNESDGTLFVGTNLGINVFKEDTYFFIDKEQGFSNYNSSQAVIDQEKLYIATKNGYYILNTQYFKQKRNVLHKARVDELYINNIKREWNGSQHLVLPYDQNNIRLHFSIANAKYPGKLKYKFRLKETESWREVTDHYQIILHYLNFDHYQIQLQITDEDSGTVREQNMIHFTITPPFYLRWPFWAGCLIVLSIIASLIYSLRMKYVRKEQDRKLAFLHIQNEQEKKELIFNRKLAELKLKALKSQMNSHFVFNVLASIQHYILKKDFENSLKYLEKFSQLIRKTLESSDKELISLKEEIYYIEQYVEIENLRVENEIKLVLRIDAKLDVSKIWVTPLLLQPFIENAIVHAFPSRIEKPEIQICVTKEKEKIQILIQDNGIGFKSKKSTTHQSKGISIVESKLALTQKTLDKFVEITTSEHGTQVKILLSKF